MDENLGASTRVIFFFIVFVVFPTAAFLSAGLLSRFLTNAGQLLLNVGFLFGLVLLSAYLYFGLARDQVPSNTDFVRFVLLQFALLPATVGATLGIVAGKIQKVSGGL
ncbi:MAG: hypothetical protein AAF496_04845 [Pseudomonadota bacterium]